MVIEKGGDYNKMKKQLIEAGILLDADRQVVLSKGCKYISVPQTACWVMRMTHPKLMSLGEAAVTNAVMNRLTRTGVSESFEDAA